MTTTEYAIESVEKADAKDILGTGSYYFFNAFLVVGGVVRIKNVALDSHFKLSYRFRIKLWNMFFCILSPA